MAGGNQQVAERLAAGLRVELGTPAVRVAQVGDGLRVNDDLDVDAVVVSVPAPATDGIAFDPPLPAWKADALARVVYGQAAKLAVPLLARARASSVLSVPEHFWTWTAKDGDGAVAPLVTAFAGSGPAVDALRVDDGAGAVPRAGRGAAARPRARRRGGGALDLAGRGLQRAPARPAGGSRRPAGSHGRANRLRRRAHRAALVLDHGGRAAKRRARRPPAARKRLKRPPRGRDAVSNTDRGHRGTPARDPDEDHDGRDTRLAWLSQTARIIGVKHRFGPRQGFVRSP